MAPVLNTGVNIYTRQSLGRKSKLLIGSDPIGNWLGLGVLRFARQQGMGREGVDMPVGVRRRRSAQQRRGEERRRRLPSGHRQETNERTKATREGEPTCAGRVSSPLPDLVGLLDRQQPAKPNAKMLWVRENMRQ
jgi:hypothetical protein